MTTQALEPTPQEVLDEALFYVTLGVAFGLAGYWMCHVAFWRWLERMVE